jgi:enoyl-CoA hydratase/carnithine racemase
MRPRREGVVVTGAGGNFSSGGDVFEIIGPLTRWNMPGSARLHPHDRRSGQGDARLPAADHRRDRRHLRRRRRDHGDGLRHAPRHAGAKTAFLFTRVGLAGCDMGACAILPRIIGQGRAAELLYTGRVMTARRASAGASHNRLVAPEALLDEALPWPARSPPGRPSRTASPRRS